MSYRIEPGVIRQVDIRLHGYVSSEAALDDLADTISPDEAVGILSFRGELYELNSVGLLLWDQLVEGRTTGELAAYVADRYDLDADTAGVDVAAFVQSMTAIGVLTPGSSVAATL